MEVLTASVRNLDHLLYAIKLGSDIITSPFKILKEWGEKGMRLPGPDYVYDAHGLKPIRLRGDRPVQELAGVRYQPRADG